MQCHKLGSIAFLVVVLFKAQHSDLAWTLIVGTCPPGWLFQTLHTKFCVHLDGIVAKWQSLRDGPGLQEACPCQRHPSPSRRALKPR